MIKNLIWNLGSTFFSNEEIWLAIIIIIISFFYGWEVRLFLWSPNFGTYSFTTQNNFKIFRCQCEMWKHYVFKIILPYHWTKTVINIHWLVNRLKYLAEQFLQIFHASLSESTTTAFLSTDKNIFLWIFYIVSLLLQKRNDVNRNGWHSLTLFHKYVKAVVEKIYIFLKKKVFPKSKS